jgi:hypothetical protein
LQVPRPSMTFSPSMHHLLRLKLPRQPTLS